MQRLEPFLHGSIPMDVLEIAYPNGFHCSDLVGQVHQADMTAISNACFPVRLLLIVDVCFVGSALVGH